MEEKKVNEAAATEESKETAAREPAEAVKTAEPIDLEKEEAIREFIGDKYDVYRRKFDNLKAGLVGWNWCAFLVSTFWFLYRKMYLWFAVFLLGSTVASSVVQSITATPEAVAQATGMAPAGSLYGAIATFIAGSIIPGLFGDRIYQSHIERKYKKSASRDEFVKRGGVNKVAVIIFIALMVVIIGVYSGVALHEMVVYDQIMDI